jgi:pimeloyl-ACP methyl ester carboxylesterase
MFSVLRCALASAALVAASFQVHISRAAPHDEFYHVSAADLSGAPGRLIRYAPVELMSIYRAKAFRILYRSTDYAGRPIAVSGVAVISTYPAPAGGRRVVAWAHPTSGVAQHCAPSLRENPIESIAGIKDMIPRGYAVVATDYPGLGVKGVVPYLLGRGEGQAVLDSVRALTQLPEAQASNHYALWGYSQGGHAALFAAGLAHSYAPELKLAGVAAAAPPTDLLQTLDDDIGTVPGRILAAMTMQSWNRALGLPLGDLVSEDTISIIQHIDKHCVDSLSSELNALSAEQNLGKNFLKSDPAKDPPWSKAMTENSAGVHAITVPVFIAQGLNDEIVPPATTKSFVSRLCAQKHKVHFVELPGLDHGMTGQKSATQAVVWMGSAFAGAAQTSGCTN